MWHKKLGKRSMLIRSLMLLSFVLLIFVGIGNSNILIGTEDQKADLAWPMFRYDLAHSGYTPVVGNASIKDYGLLWSYETGGEVLSSPVIANINNDGDGDLEVIVGSYDNKLYVFNSQGDLVWDFMAGYVTSDDKDPIYPDKGFIYSTPAIGDIDNDGELEIIVASAGGNIYAINSTGQVEWRNLNSSWLWIQSSPAIADIDNDGKMEIVVCSYGYADTPGIYVLNTMGQEKWHYLIANHMVWIQSSPAIADIDKDGDVEIIVGSSDGLHVINSSGKEEWSYTSKHWPIYGLDSSPAIADINNDGEMEIVVGSTCPFDCPLNEGQLFVFNSKGTVEWNYTAGYSVSSSPAIADIDGDGELEIIVGSYCYDTKTNLSTYGMLYVFDSKGEVEWSYQTDGAIVSSPAIADIDGDGKMEVIVGSNDGRLYVLNSKGEVEWSYQTDGAIVSSPAIADIDGDGNLEIAVGSKDKKVYVFGAINTKSCIIIGGDG